MAIIPRYNSGVKKIGTGTVPVPTCKPKLSTFCVHGIPDEPPQPARQLQCNRLGDLADNNTGHHGSTDYLQPQSSYAAAAKPQQTHRV